MTKSDFLARYTRIENESPWHGAKHAAQGSVTHRFRPPPGEGGRGRGRVRVNEAGIIRFFVIRLMICNNKRSCLSPRSSSRF